MVKRTKMIHGPRPDPEELKKGKFATDREGHVLNVILNGDSQGTNGAILAFLKAKRPVNYRGLVQEATVRCFTKSAVEAGIIEACRIKGENVYIPLADGPSFARATEKGLAFREKVLAAAGTTSETAPYTMQPTFLESGQASIDTASRSSQAVVEAAGVSSETCYTMLEELTEFDAVHERRERLEQGFIRDLLLDGRSFGPCALCGEDYPIQFLVAAHIKRRAECSAEEKRNPHNVMLACKFGCDELFERGYVHVVNGKIVAQPLTVCTSVVRNRVTWLQGKTCKQWSASNNVFFRWHARQQSCT